MEDCIFCKIINGEVEHNKIYEDEHSFAFLDRTAINKGHTLVVPKTHVSTLLKLNDKERDAIFKTAQKIAGSFKEAVGTDNFNISMNNGKFAGQVVFHAHVHVIPRFENDGYDHWEGKDCSPIESKNIAKKIRDTLARLRNSAW
ncbi:MAG: HIT family protein [Nanoarchaeota archaeon]